MALRLAAFPLRDHVPARRLAGRLPVETDRSELVVGRAASRGQRLHLDTVTAETLLAERGRILCCQSVELLEIGPLIRCHALKRVLAAGLSCLDQALAAGSIGGGLLIEGRGIESRCWRILRRWLLVGPRRRRSGNGDIRCTLRDVRDDLGEILRTDTLVIDVCFESFGFAGTSYYIRGILLAKLTNSILAKTECPLAEFCFDTRDHLME